MRLQFLVVSLLASTTHGFLFNPLMMALLRYRMGSMQSSMTRSPFIFNRGGVLDTIRRNQMANIQAILNRRRNLIRNRMGIGRRNGNVQRRFPQTPNTVSINPERLEPFGGKLGVMNPMMTIDNSPNVMSGIATGVLLNQLDYPQTNINNVGSNGIVGPFVQSPSTIGGSVSNIGQILSASPNSIPQQQVLNTQQQQQNGVIGPVQATNVMVVPQQQLGATLTTNVGPSVEIIQQVPNVAMGQAVNILAPQQQLGATITSNVGPSVVEIGQQIPNVVMNQAQTLQATNIMTQQQQLGANAVPSVIEVAQQLPAVATGQEQALQTMNALAQQQQLGANVAPSVIEVAQQLPNVAMGQALQSMTQQQQLETTNAQQQQLGAMAQQQQLGALAQQQQLEAMAQQQQLGAIAQQQQLEAISQQQQLQAMNAQQQQLQAMNAQQQQLEALTQQQQLGAMAQQQQLGAIAQQQQLGAMAQQQQLEAISQQQQLQATNAQQQQIEAIAQQQQLGALAQQQQLGAMAQQQQLQATNSQQQQLEAIAQTQQLQAMETQQQQLGTMAQQQQLGTMAQQQQLGTMAQQQQLGAISRQQQLEAMAQQQQLGAIAKQQQLGAMAQQQRLQAMDAQQQQLQAMAQQQQLEANIGSPVLEVTQQQLNLATDPLQNLQESSVIATANALGNQLQQQAMLNQIRSSVADPQLVNMDNAIASTQQQLTAIQNGIAEAKLQEQIIEANNKASQKSQVQAQLRLGELGSMAINPNQQQLINSGNTIDLQQQAAIESAEQQHQQQLLEMNNAVQNQATNVLSPFPQQPNLAESFVQQLLNYNNARSQQQAMSHTTQQQTQLNNIPQNQVPNIVDVNNVFGMQGQVGSSEIGSNMILDPSQQFSADIAIQQQLGPNVVNEPLSVNLNQPQVPFGQITEQTQTLVDTNTLNPEQQMGSAITGSNIVIDPIHQQTIDLNLAVEPQPQTTGSVTDPSQQAAIGTNLGPGNTEQQTAEMINAAASTEQIMSNSPEQQTSFASNPTNLQQQMINPHAPLDQLWQLGSTKLGMPYLDPLQELSLVQDPYTQNILYSNQAMTPTFVNVPSNGQLPVEQGQVPTPTGQSEIPTPLQQGVPAQGSFTAKQQQFNSQQTDVNGQPGPWNQIQSQQTPWLSNLQPDPNQPYMINEPSLSGLQQNSQTYSQTQQILDTVQPPQVIGSQNPGAATGNANTASSSQLPMTSFGTPASSQTASGSSGTIQQNSQLSDQSLQYRQAILDSILSSLKPQVVYNPLGGLNVPVESSAASQTNQATLTAAASGNQVLQTELALPLSLSAPMPAEIGKQPTSPQPSFTVSDVIKSLATGSDVSNLPVQKTILADKKTFNVQPVQQALISNQYDMTAVTTPSPSTVATPSPAQDAKQPPVQNTRFYGAQPRGSIIQSVYSPSAYVPRNDFWGELALANAIFNHPKLPLRPTQEQQKVPKEKQKVKQLDSLLQSLMLASILPGNKAVKMAPLGFKSAIGLKASPVVRRGDQNQLLSASNNPNSSKPLTAFSKTAKLNPVFGVTPTMSLPQNSGIFSTKVPDSPPQTTSSVITLAPVTLPTPSQQNQRTILSQSVVRRNQPEASFTPQTPLMNSLTSRKQSTPVMAM